MYGFKGWYLCPGLADLDDCLVHFHAGLSSVYGLLGLLYFRERSGRGLAEHPPPDRR